MRIGACDTETTGLNPDKDRIIEFALIVYDEHGNELEAFETLINPGFPVPEKITEITGITTQDVAMQPALDQVMARKIAAAIDGCDAFVAHNAGFDVRFINKELERNNIKMPSKPVLDTAQARWATEDGKMPNLRELCFAVREHYDPSVAHRARYDVERMMGAVFKSMKLGYFEELSLMIKEVTGAQSAA